MLLFWVRAIKRRLKVAKPSYRNNFYGFWGDGYGEFDSDGY